MALLEQEAIRLAESLNDYDHVSATDMGATTARTTSWSGPPLRCRVRDRVPLRLLSLHRSARQSPPLPGG